MREDEKQGDLQSTPSGDYSVDNFPDWDNPEDFDEDEPEGYYEDELLDHQEGYVPGPDDPDYDLSEAAGYADWEPGPPTIIPQWIIALVSILVILALSVPAVLVLR